MRRILRLALWSMLALLAAVGALFWYFLYAPAPRYSAPLRQARAVRASHGAGACGPIWSMCRAACARARRWSWRCTARGGTGGAAADRNRIRPRPPCRCARLCGRLSDGYDGYWNACNIAGDYSANTLDIDDVGFVGALIDRLAGEDRHRSRPRVCCRRVARRPYGVSSCARSTGPVSAPSRSSRPICPRRRTSSAGPPAHGTPSVLIMNGTAGPLESVRGGDARLLGLFMGAARVLSSRETGQYFADRNGIAGRAASRPDANRGRNSRRTVSLAQRRGGAKSSSSPFVAADMACRSPTAARRAYWVPRCASRTGRP